MKDKSGTYQLAKDVHNLMELNSAQIIEILPENVRLFRKHLSDITRRNQWAFGRKFTTRYIKGKLTIFRIA